MGCRLAFWRETSDSMFSCGRDEFWGSGGRFLRIEPGLAVGPEPLVNVEVFLQLLKGDCDPDLSPAALADESRPPQFFLANPMGHARRRDAAISAKAFLVRISFILG